MYLYNLKYRLASNPLETTALSLLKSHTQRQGLLAQHLDRLVESTADDPPPRRPDDPLVILRRQQDLNIADDRAPLVRLSSQPRPFRLEFAPLLRAEILPFLRKQVLEFLIGSGDPVRAAREADAPLQVDKADDAVFGIDDDSGSGREPRVPRIEIVRLGGRSVQSEEARRRVERVEEDPG